MFKKIINIILIFITLLFSINVKALLTSDAKEEIDVSKKASLKINYQYEDCDFNDVLVKIYKIASINNDFSYELNNVFKDYPLKINGLKTKEEYQILNETLISYIYADSIKEDKKEIIKDNTIIFKNLDLGLYLVETMKLEKDKYTLIVDSFLINIPNLEEDGTWNYDVSVFPKTYFYEPNNEIKSYKVVKKWEDSEINIENVDIEIYKNGELFEKVILNSSNNWLYEWEVDDDESIWHVVERNIPKGYKVSILRQDNIFTILNTNNNYEEENPQTLDNINLYLYLLIFSIISLTIIIIYLFRKKKNR